MAVVVVAQLVELSQFESSRRQTFISVIYLFRNYQLYLKDENKEKEAV